GQKTAQNPGALAAPARAPRPPEGPAVAAVGDAVVLIRIYAKSTAPPWVAHQVGPGSHASFCLLHWVPALGCSASPSVIGPEIGLGARTRYGAATCHRAGCWKRARIADRRAAPGQHASAWFRLAGQW